MGCVFGKEISSSETPSWEVVVGRRRENGEHRDLAAPSGRREKVVTVNKVDGGDVGAVQNGRDQKKDDNGRPRGERRRSKPNPRMSNPPKNVHGEQVAAGWPSWLSEVAGEAINGWIPRRADAFEKLAKASKLFFLCLLLVSVLWIDIHCHVYVLYCFILDWTRYL